MKKKKMTVMVILLIAVSSFFYSNAKELDVRLKVFINADGEEVLYPILEGEEVEPDKASEYLDNDAYKSVPDTAKIGDVFKTADGYERVIAVSEDGAFVTEIIE